MALLDGLFGSCKPLLQTSGTGLLAEIREVIIASPADNETIDVWAPRSGLSERTLGRLTARETGLSFGHWRRQLGVMLVVKWLEAAPATARGAEPVRQR